MKELQLLGVSLKDYSLREVMRQVDDYLAKGKCNTIVLVTMRGLIAAKDSEQVRSFLESVDITVPAESDILRAANVVSRNRNWEIDNDEFTKSFLHKLVKQRKTVYYLTSTREQLQSLKQAVSSYEPNLRVVGEYSLDQLEKDEDFLINEINVETPNILISNLSSPQREEFFETNHMKLNVQIWLMLKDEVVHKKIKNHPLQKVLQFVESRLFSLRVNKYQSEEEEEK